MWTTDHERERFGIRVKAIIGFSTGLRSIDTDLFLCERREWPLQVSGMCEPAIDSLLIGATSTASREESLPVWQEYGRARAQAQPYTFLFYPHAIDGVSDRLRGFEPTPRGWFADARRWWLADE